MKKFIIGLSILSTFGLVVFGKKIIQAKDGLKISLGKFRMEKPISSLAEVFTMFKSFNTIITVDFSNFTKNNYTINQIQLEIYSMSDQLVASQASPISSPIVVKPQVVSSADVVFAINGTSALQLAFKGTSLNDLFNFLSNNPKGLGKQLKAKGFIVAEGIKVKVDQIINV